MSIKVNTIEQFHIIQEIKKHFDMDEITLELVDKNTITVTDKNEDSITFIYAHGQVTWE